MLAAMPVGGRSFPAATSGLSRPAELRLPRSHPPRDAGYKSTRCDAALLNMNTKTETILVNSLTTESQSNSLRFAANNAAAEAPFPSGTPILSQRQLADYLGLCERSVRNLERRGVIPRIKLGKRTVYRLDSILAALARLEQEGRAA